MDKNLILQVQKLRKDGFSYGQIAAKMKLTKSQANYICKLSIEKIEEKKASKTIYEEKVCKLATTCNSIHEICKLLGHKGTNEYYKQIRKILEKNEIDTSHFGTKEEISVVKKKFELKKILCKDGIPYQTSKLRDRLIKEGYKEYKCERCGRTEWEGKPIPLQLHHINGDNKDNRLENLQILCPNCHAFTDNYCGRKQKQEQNVCKICGKEISRNAEYCTDCYHSLVQSRTNPYKKTYTRNSKRPQNKEELIESFKECGSFRGVGKKYDVTDNAVKKWCIFYNLPQRALAMRKFLKDYYNEDLKWKFNKGNNQALRTYQKENFKKVCLLNKETNEIEKIYNTLEELKNDGFNSHNVYKVCRGKLKTHKKRKFKYL